MFTPGSVCSAALRLVRHCAAEAIDSRPARARRSKGEIDMHFDTWYMPLQASLGTYLPTILGALAVLLIGWIIRSEEHTSELQSLMRISYAVFCLKKTKKTPTAFSIIDPDEQ